MVLSLAALLHEQESAQSSTLPTNDKTTDRKRRREEEEQQQDTLDERLYGAGPASTSYLAALPFGGEGLLSEEEEDLFAGTSKTTQAKDGAEEEEEEEWEEVDDATGPKEVIDLSHLTDEVLPPKKAYTKRELQLMHQCTLLCLLGSLKVRNTWCNHSLLQAAVIGQIQGDVPLDFPQSTKRSLLQTCKAYLQSLKRLTEWWKQHYKVDTLLTPPIRTARGLRAFLSRDFLSVETSVLLFTALLRGFDLEARLVSSLQPVAGSMRLKLKAKEDTTRPPPKRQKKPPLPPKDPTVYSSSQPPTWWCEVKLPDESWLTIDPVRGKVGCLGEMEGSGHQQMGWVVAFEEDGSAKDVTRKYASQWGAVTAKLRKEGMWWDEVMAYLARRKETAADKKEEAQFRKTSLLECMPTTLQGFLNHPLYAIERQIRQRQVIYPREPVVGVFRKDPVYPRAHVRSLESEQGWLVKHGRTLKSPEETPAKLIPAPKKPAKRGQEAPPPEVGREIALYGEWQTVLAPALSLGPDGKVPRNEFGNLELYAPHMLPAGAVHLSGSPFYRKVATVLNVSFADAMVGFEMKGGRMIPRLDGIVVAHSSEALLTEAHACLLEEEATKLAQERAVRAHTHWHRLLHALRIRARLNEEYGHL